MKKAWNISFFVFHNIGPNFAQILPQRPLIIYFFLADFQWNMLGYSINFKNLCCNLIVIKKI